MCPSVAAWRESGAAAGPEKLSRTSSRSYRAERRRAIVGFAAPGAAQRANCGVPGGLEGAPGRQRARWQRGPSGAQREKDFRPSGDARDTGLVPPATGSA